MVAISLLKAVRRVETVPLPSMRWQFTAAGRIRWRRKQPAGLIREDPPVEPPEHPFARSGAHLGTARCVIEKTGDPRGEEIGCVARHQFTRDRRPNGFGRSTRVSSDDGLTTRLRFEQHNSKAFEVPTNLPIRQDEEIALLITRDQLGIAWRRSKLDDGLDAVFTSKGLEILAFPPFADDRVKHIGALRPYQRKCTDQRVLPFSLLQRADSQDHAMPVPSEASPHGIVPHRRFEMIGVNAWMHDDDSTLRRAPVIHQQILRMVTVRNQLVGTIEDEGRQIPQFPTRRGKRQFLAMDEAPEWNACQSLDCGRNQPLRQALPAMNHLRPRTPDDGSDRTDDAQVMRGAAWVENAPVGKSEAQTFGWKTGRRVERRGVTMRADRQNEVEAGEAPVELPKPSAASTVRRRKYLRKKQNLQSWAVPRSFRYR